MFNVVVNDGTKELPKDDIFYIVAKEGIFLKKKMGIMESIAPVKNISILQSVDTMAKMHINPIPAITGAKILEFFRAVYNKFQSEAIVLLFYNESTGKYKVVPPNQKVTSASLNYNRGVTVEGYSMIGTIHSHGAMSAFHSGIDDADEKTFDGLHITFGNVKDNEISISASIVSNGHRFIVDIDEYMSGIVKTKDIDKTEVYYTHKIYKLVDGKAVLDEEASSKNAFVSKKLDKRYIFKVGDSKKQFNIKWMNVVERGTSVYNYGFNLYNGIHPGWSGPNPWSQRFQGNNKWGRNYDSSIWNQHAQNLPSIIDKTKAQVKPIQFPAHNQYDSKNPCLSCANRNIKIMDEMEGVEYEEEMYLCENCKTIISTAEADIKCPTCKTDDYLILIDEKDGLEDNYIKGDPPRLDSSVYAQQYQQPDQDGYLTCLECGNSFLKLSSDECCPYCQTLLPDTVVNEQEWECPYCQAIFGESEMLEIDRCPHCSMRITLGESQMTQPQSFLNQTEQEHQAILDASAEADKMLERIPDPELQSDRKVPLSTAPSNLMETMRKLFGGKIKNDKTH